MHKALLSDDEKKDFFFKFNVEGLLRGDYKSRMEGYATGINNGFMCVNDVRRLENWNPVPDEEGGNLFMVNGNMVPLKDAGAAYKVNDKEKEEDPDEDKEEVLGMEKPGRSTRGRGAGS